MSIMRLGLFPHTQNITRHCLYFEAVISIIIVRAHQNFHYIKSCWESAHPYSSPVIDNPLESFSPKFEWKSNRI